MDEKALFTKFWTQESKTTRNVLARIPESSAYRPDPRSRTAQEIAWQIVCEEKMIIEALENGKAEWAPPPMPESMKDVLAEYERQSAEVLRRWSALPNKALPSVQGPFLEEAIRILLEARGRLMPEKPSELDERGYSRALDRLSERIGVAPTMIAYLVHKEGSR